MFTCPVCFYNRLQDLPQDYNICECCGTEFGADDEMFTHAQLRERWVCSGAHWFHGHAPLGWNAVSQLMRANVTAPCFFSPRFAYANAHHTSNTDHKLFSLAHRDKCSDRELELVA